MIAEIIPSKDPIIELERTASDLSKENGIVVMNDPMEKRPADMNVIGKYFLISRYSLGKTKLMRSSPMCDKIREHRIIKTIDKKLKDMIF